MISIRNLLTALIRFLVVWFVNTLSLAFAAWILSGVNIQSSNGIPVFVIAIGIAFVLGLVNLIVRPLILLIAMPLGWVALLIIGFFIDGLTLLITSALLPALYVENLWWAFLGGLVIAFANTILTSILDLDDENSIYENLILRRAVRQAGRAPTESGRGIVMLEVDGLSYWHIQKAIADGYMPTVKMMMDEYGYKLSRVDCGLPATTPACQAGILQGNNNNIPSFRWMDKETGKMLAGGQAAMIIEPSLSDGNGLLRGGSSIGNMFSGDADFSILTFSKIKGGTPEDKKKRAQDMFLVMRNPYFITRVLVLFLGDVIQEIWQGWQQRRHKVEPRVNRLEHGYPLLRAAINVFLRDIATYFTILDIVRGTPAMYTLYAGYDEVAHHAGPWTRDAMLTLRQFDNQVARILRVIQTKAPRPYELLLLSDHGQSFGPTFKQRYGISLPDLVKSLMPGGTTVSSTGGGDDGTIGVSAMMDELDNMKDNQVGGRVSNALINSTQRAVNRNLGETEAFKEVKAAKATVAYSGNFAQAYFDLFPRKITVNELNAAYPGLVDSLVHHEGIGFVVGYDDDGTPIAFGKGGARNLHTGEIVGADPLAPFGDVDLRARQVRRVADFSNAGDLVINSTIYPDGSVAALEELIGNHGGLGGEQTDAYLLHPQDMLVPETWNSFQMKDILDSRRGLPGSPYESPKSASAPQVNPWTGSILLKGLSQVGKWLGYAGRVILLDRDAFREIAADVYMTAPALLIAFLAQVIQSVYVTKSFDPLNILARCGAWLLSFIAVLLMVRFLRGRPSLSTNLRVVGFVGSVHVLELLGFVPVIGPLMRIIALLLAFFGVWIGTATANKIRGGRAFLIPVVYILVVVFGTIFILAAVKSVSVTVDAILNAFGWSAVQ